jgi:hypothetical protein
MTSSPRFDNRFLDDLRSRIDLVRLIGRDVDLKRKGREYTGLSPFNAEKTPSFTVVPAKGFWHCFSSGEHGDAIGWMTRYHRLDFPTAVAELARTAGLDLPEGAERPRQGRDSTRDSPAAAGPRPSSPDRTDRADKGKRERGYALWRSRTGPVRGTVAETYLVEARGIAPDCLPDASVLGFRGDMPLSEFVDGRYREIWRGPAMLAALQWPDGRFAACHVTWLQPDGSGKLVLFDDAGERRKVKKVFGMARGAAIRLAAPAERMQGGEGIETTLSVASATGIPGWCSYSLDNLAGGGLGDGPFYPDKRKNRAGRWMRLPSRVPDMARPGFLPPAECRRFTLLGDGDTRDLLALEAKLVRGCRRFIQMGIEADYSMSPRGTDFNDLMRAEVAA